MFSFQVTTPALGGPFASQGFTNFQTERVFFSYARRVTVTLRTTLLYVSRFAADVADVELIERPDGQIEERERPKRHGIMHRTDC